MLAVVLLVSACSSGDDPERGLDALETPQFAPVDGGAASTEPAAVEGGPGTSSPITAAPDEQSAETTTTLATIGGTEAVRDAGEPAPAEEHALVSLDDPVGDAVGGLDQDPPAWSDLAGAALERQADAYRLTVRLGGHVPERQPGDETMNIATFFDVDGDGSIDHELWVNLGEDGWGPVWYHDDGPAQPGERANVSIAVEGHQLHLRFPGAMMRSPERFRFSVASEYGELSVIGSDFARRDDAPDDDEAVNFP